MKNEDRLKKLENSLNAHATSIMGLTGEAARQKASSLIAQKERRSLNLVVLLLLAAAAFGACHDFMDSGSKWLEATSKAPKQGTCFE